MHFKALLLATLTSPLFTALLALQATVDLLRHIVHRLKLVQKLRTQMAAADSGGEWWASRAGALRA